jgi:hypothetical protein
LYLIPTPNPPTSVCVCLKRLAFRHANCTKVFAIRKLQKNKHKVEVSCCWCHSSSNEKMNYFLLPSLPEGGPAYSPAARAINKIIDRTLLCFLGYIIRTTKKFKWTSRRRRKRVEVRKNAIYSFFDIILFYKKEKKKNVVSFVCCYLGEVSRRWSCVYNFFFPIYITWKCCCCCSLNIIKSFGPSIYAKCKIILKLIFF